MWTEWGPRWVSNENVSCLWRVTCPENTKHHITYLSIFGVITFLCCVYCCLRVYVSVCVCVCGIRSTWQSSRRCCVRCQRRTSSWTLLNTGLQRIITCRNKSTAWRSALPPSWGKKISCIFQSINNTHSLSCFFVVFLMKGMHKMLHLIGLFSSIY